MEGSGRAINYGRTHTKTFALRGSERPHIWRVAASIPNKQLRRADKGWSCSLEELNEVLTTPQRKKKKVSNVKKHRKGPCIWTDLFVAGASCECCHDTSGFINEGSFLTSCGPGNFSGRTVLHTDGWLVSQSV
jgi:hypothetical protein